MAHGALGAARPASRNRAPCVGLASARKQPTPEGVPVRMRSPGWIVTNLDIQTMTSTGVKISSLVFESCAHKAALSLGRLKKSAAPRFRRV